MTRLITAKRNIKDLKLSGCLRDGHPNDIIGRRLFCAFTELKNGKYTSIRYNYCNPDHSKKSIGDKILFYQSRCSKKKSLQFQGLGTIIDIMTQHEILSDLDLRADYNWMMNNIVGKFYGYTTEEKKNKKWAVVRIDKLISPMKSIELSNQQLLMGEVNKPCIQHGRVIHSNGVKNIVDAII